MSWQIYIPKIKPISQKTTGKSPENLILTKGNNSHKIQSSVTKLKLDLYYVMTNSYTKFQVNISKDSIEKSRKLILAKGNNSRKSRSSVTKLKLDLYYVMTNSSTKFQVNISKGGRKKSGKLNFSKGQ